MFNYNNTLNGVVCYILRGNFDPSFFPAKSMQQNCIFSVLVSESIYSTMYQISLSVQGERPFQNIHN
jgi:hypothetical protein